MDEITNAARQFADGLHAATGPDLRQVRFESFIAGVQWECARPAGPVEVPTPMPPIPVVPETM